MIDKKNKLIKNIKGKKDKLINNIKNKKLNKNIKKN